MVKERMDLEWFIKSSLGCEKNDIELVFLPTNASWLNRIECHFTALRKFAIRKLQLPKSYPSWQAQ